MKRRSGGVIVVSLAVVGAIYYGLRQAPSRGTPATTSSESASVVVDAPAPPVLVQETGFMPLPSVDPSSQVAIPKVDSRCPAGQEMQDNSGSHPPNTKGCVSKRADGSLWREGTWTMVMSDGRVEIGDFVHDVREGRWTTWYPQGGKAEEATYLHGHLDGWEVKWGEDGRKVVERPFSMGFLDGTVNIYHPDGRVVHEVWKHGERMDATGDVLDGGFAPPIVIKP